MNKICDHLKREKKKKKKGKKSKEIKILLIYIPKFTNYVQVTPFIFFVVKIFQFFNFCCSTYISSLFQQKFLFAEISLCKDTITQNVKVKINFDPAYSYTKTIKVLCSRNILREFHLKHWARKFLLDLRFSTLCNTSSSVIIVV